MKKTLTAVVCAAACMSAICAPPAMAQQVYVGDQFRTRLVHPSRLSLWASDALVKLNWSGWGGPVATATGQVSTHSMGQYSYSPATVRASRRRMCGGRMIYSKLLYQAFGEWHAAKLYGKCQFSA